MDYTNLISPLVGGYALRILTPTLLELRQINTKAPDPAEPATWNLVNSSGALTAPDMSQFVVTVSGQTVVVESVGFRRRVSFAPLSTYDLRIDNALYLTLGAPIADNSPAAVTNPSESVFPSGVAFSVTSSPIRYSPAIHVNQEGYVPSFPKKAMVGYYLGDMGEMSVAAASFSIIDVNTNAVVYQGALTLRQEVGYTTSPLPYQQVYEADFSSFTIPGEYQIQVEGMGASLPFLVNDGIAMAWVRSYALGMYEQRSGAPGIGLPWTRFAHAADHTAPASMPVPDTSPAFAFTWTCIKSYTSQVTANQPPLQFPQTAPTLTSDETSLYPFVNTGTVDVSGGHWDAGDYSKYTENSAQLVHELIFAVDNSRALDAGQPRHTRERRRHSRHPSGGQMGADFLIKMQDADGGFYFLVYPINEEYEGVLPQNGEAQVVWPKNTSVSGAATAAMAEAGSSPSMIQYYPSAKPHPISPRPMKGWAFLQAATAKYGASSYQKLTFYSDDWQDNDEYAWAASALYAATGDAAYQDAALRAPSKSKRLVDVSLGMVVHGGRLGQRHQGLCLCRIERTAARIRPRRSVPCACAGRRSWTAGDDVVAWVADNAYGTPFPPPTKAVLGGGWYFSLDQASDAAVAYLVSPNPAFLDALVSAMNYEGGTNPVMSRTSPGSA
jgi:hypothetical protein